MNKSSRPYLSQILGVVFIFLKLLDIITWDWIWVLAPLWLPFALFVFIIAATVVLEMLLN